MNDQRRFCWAWLGVALVLGLFACTHASAAGSDDVAPAMADAAKKFLASLTPDQQAIAVMTFDDPKREDWHNIPKPTRKGVPLMNMTPAEREVCMALVHTALSDRGFTKVGYILALENNVRAGEKGQPIAALRDSGRYYLTIFGKPQNTGEWGWSFEGHHLSLNFVIKDGQVISDTPTFWGANPATVKVLIDGGPPVGTRTLGDEEQAALDLAAMLDDAQRKQATIAADAPADYRAAGKPQPPATSAEGLCAKDMSAEEQKALWQLLDTYNGNLAPALAAARHAAIESAGLDQVYFAWMGPMQAGQRHAFRIHGPTFLLEMVNYQSDGFGNAANHIHSVWRNPQGDFAVPLH